MTTTDRTKSWSELIVFENIGHSVHRLSSFSCLFIAASAKKQADVIVNNVKCNAMHSSSALALIHYKNNYELYNKISLNL